MLADVFFPKEANHYLKQEYAVRKQRRPHYSLRAFARDLGVSPSTLSEFLNGKTGFSKERVAAIARKIHLNEEQTEHFWDLNVVKYSHIENEKRLAIQRSTRRAESLKSFLSLDQFEMVSNWYHLVILELIDLDLKFQDIHKLASTLEISEAETEEAIARLERLGMLKKESGVLKSATPQTLVGNGTSSLAIRKYHHQMMEKASEALDIQAVDERGFRSIVFSMNHQDISNFKRDLVLMTNQLIDKYHSPKNKDLVSALNVQFFHFNIDENQNDSKNEAKDEVKCGDHEKV